MYKKYTTWIDKNRAFYQQHKTLLHPWLTQSREDDHWKGAMRKFEWQVPENIIGNLDQLLWSCRGSGIRVKNIDYVPTLVAINHTPVYGPLNRKLVPQELLKLQSFPEDFKYDEKSIYKQVGNAVNVEVIYRSAMFLIQDQPLFEAISN
jgi:site-specific DNA-cytosine methylase